MRSGSSCAGSSASGPTSRRTLADGECDGIWCGSAITPERERRFLYTRPYAVFDEAVVVRAGDSVDVRGRPARPPRRRDRGQHQHGARRDVPRGRVRAVRRRHRRRPRRHAARAAGRRGRRGRRRRRGVHRHRAHVAGHPRGLLRRHAQPLGLCAAAGRRASSRSCSTTASSRPTSPPPGAAGCRRCPTRCDRPASSAPAARRPAAPARTASAASCPLEIAVSV